VGVPMLTYANPHFGAAVQNFYRYRTRQNRADGEPWRG
jgi:hypothetical protein